MSGAMSEAMSGDNEPFLHRWSRLKREQAAPPAAAPAPAAPADNPVAADARREQAAPLPPVEQLKPDSDFTPFMNAQVDPATRRSALKKLFADAHYNVPDPFEAYSEDYTRGDPIPAQMLKAINRARDLAVKGPEQVAEDERLEAERLARTEAAVPDDSAPTPESVPSDADTGKPNDVAGRQDA
jgi:hypothetical protein